jgi:hypothetical protein
MVKIAFQASKPESVLVPVPVPERVPVPSFVAELLVFFLDVSLYIPSFA